MATSLFVICDSDLFRLQVIKKNFKFEERMSHTFNEFVECMVELFSF